MGNSNRNSYLGNGLDLGRWSVTGSGGDTIAAPVRASGGEGGLDFSTTFYHIIGDGNSYRGYGASQMAILMEELRIARRNQGTRTIRFANGDVVKCTKNFERHDIYIYVPAGGKEIEEDVKKYLTGVIMHPRSGPIENLHYTEYVAGPYGSMPESRHFPGVMGGWERGKKLLTTQYIYPLVDNDNASFAKGSLTTKYLEDNVPARRVINDKFSGFVTPGVYGNLYWDNGAAYDTETKKWDKSYVSFSWRGTPTRHFRLPGNIDIPGFSTFETSTPGMIEDTPVYTAFGTALYQGGKLLKYAPTYSWPYNSTGVRGRCLILGAMQDDTKAIYIITHSDRYYAPGGVAKPGFYLMLWTSKITKIEGKIRVDGWELIYEANYKRNGLPWFGNKAGKSFKCGNGDKIDITVEVVEDGDDIVTASFTGYQRGSWTYKEKATKTGTFGAATVYDITTLEFIYSGPSKPVVHFHEYATGE